MTTYYAYRPLPDGSEPPDLDPDGTPNPNRITFRRQRCSMAVRRAQQLLGPDVVIYSYEDFMDRTTWKRITVSPYRGPANAPLWWCVCLSNGQRIRYQANTERTAKRRAWRRFGADVTVYRCVDPADESTWVSVTWPGPEESTRTGEQP